MRRQIRDGNWPRPVNKSYLLGEQMCRYITLSMNKRKFNIWKAISKVQNIFKNRSNTPMWGYIWHFQWLNDISGISLQDYILKSFIHSTSHGTPSYSRFPQQGISTLKCSDHANRRLPAVSLPTTATVVFSSRIVASKFSLIQLFGGGDQTTSFGWSLILLIPSFFMLHEDFKNLLGKISWITFGTLHSSFISSHP